MNVAVVGSRGFPHLELVDDVLDIYLELYGDIHIVSGGAPGVDQQAARWAELRFGPAGRTIIRPEWKRPDGSYNPAAAFERNMAIVSASERVLAYWSYDFDKGRWSGGTLNALQHAKKQGKPTHVIKYRYGNIWQEHVT